MNVDREEPWDWYSWLFEPKHSNPKKIIVPEMPTQPNPIQSYNGYTSSSIYKWGVNGGWGLPTTGEISQSQGKIGKSYGVLGYGNA